VDGAVGSIFSISRSAGGREPVPFHRLPHAAQRARGSAPTETAPNWRGVERQRAGSPAERGRAASGHGLRRAGARGEGELGLSTPPATTQTANPPEMSPRQPRHRHTPETPRRENDAKALPHRASPVLTFPANGAHPEPLSDWPVRCAP